MPEIRMHEARYVATGKDDVIVVLPESTATVTETVRYDPAAHKNRLKDGFTLACRYCTAKVHFNKGSKAICGDNLAGASPHFHTNPGQVHDESCQWPALQDDGEHNSKYDDGKGYKIHLNTTGFAARFNREAGAVYERDEDRKIVTLNSDLIDRRPVSIRSLDDIIALLKRERNYGRLRDSRVVHHTHILPWDSFLIRYNRVKGAVQNRFADLVRQMKPGTRRPCLMEFNLASGAWAKENCAKSEPVKIGVTADGRPEYACPQAWLDLPRKETISPDFNEAGRYLVLGYVRLHRREYRDRVAHYLNISISDPGQVKKLDLAPLVPKP